MGSSNTTTHHLQADSCESLVADIKLLNYAFSRKRIKEELKMHLKIKPASSLTNIFRKHFFWKIFRFNIKLQLFGKIENDEYQMGEMKLQEFYEIYELVQNIDILLDGKPWNTLDLKQLFTSKLREQNEEEEQKENGVTTYDENECVICLNHQIETILPCFHAYCNSCIRTIFIDKNIRECPMCRREVPNTGSRIFANSIVIANEENLKQDLLENLRIAINKIAI